MLTISGLKKFYFVPDINDIRCGAHRLLEIVKHKHHLQTDNGDVFIFMSKNHRTVKMVNYASCSLLANLVFNKYHMNTPVYREMVRLLNNKMNVSRNTVYNWFVKGSDHLKKVLPVLKEKLLAKGAVVNCDETWYYLNSFWNQLILYLKDGRYNIDNSLAERTIRPMTVERKNSLTFGSHAGAKVSVIYHTFIETCKMCGVSTLEYFKEFFEAIMQGRTDYENMLPMTIGIKK